MREIVGLMPAAGTGSRLGRRRPSKEVWPIPTGPQGATRLACQDLLDNFRVAGVAQAWVLIRTGKWDIPQVLGTGEEFGVELAYRVVPPTRGTPFTLAFAGPFLKGELVALGFPDILVSPRDLLARLVAHRERTQAEVALLLAPCDRPAASDLVELDSRGRVRRLEIKPAQSSLHWTWAFALWTPRFTQFLVEWTQQFEPRKARLGREPFFGDVLTAALSHGFDIHGLAAADARILDIGTPETLAKAPSFWS
jgi:glucose-1-phosphate thymidylyltransferase